jgi:hypothetical protein
MVVVFRHRAMPTSTRSELRRRHGEFVQQRRKVGPVEDVGDLPPGPMVNRSHR